ncbi:ribonuclease P protein subunit p25-like protein [Eupeodes corollae]|uniref:ribonuclease P protein subunit p25-like protein n=1 Tax=Eupeodes corollae TaxID=290404 RepID=UPI0024938830|nr:ribonuclease P protein subunit p25-like protein [Eupeodes corollae]XP_055916983.1 ribonuclease P protein subunit p25-like protein [Eupeodes corollae]
MMHYRKGENIEEEITKENLPFENLPKDFLWMHVKGGTKVSNVIDYAKKSLDKAEYRTLVWSGYGGGIVKTISCAEILKRSYPLHQITRLTYKTIEEQWEPQMEGLEQIIANRQIPCIHILLTLDEVDEKTNGLQKSGNKTSFWVERSANDSKSNQPSGSGRNRKDQGKQRYGNQNKNSRNPNKPFNQNKPPQQKQQRPKPPNPEPMDS